jgi:hypothetical protein
MSPRVWCGSRLVPGLHSSRFLYLRKHSFGEVQALLCLAQLPPQVTHLEFERLEPRQELGPAWSLAQALGP